MKKFKNIVLVGKYKNYELNGFVQKIANFLTGLQCNIFLDSDTKNNSTLNYPEATGKDYDLVIAIGGDGTMMGAARKWGITGISLLGINQGRVGFLTDIAGDDVFEKLPDVINGKYKEEKRDILNVCVTDGKTVVHSDVAVNDLVVGRGASGKLMEFSLFLNNEFISSQKADGIIISTSTGSTAYSLAAGGSIIHCEAPVFHIVPICPQALSNRPLIVPMNLEIKILFSGTQNVNYMVDGQESPSIAPDYYFLIKNHSQKIKLIHPENYSYFEGLRTKLKWCQD